MIVGLGHRVGQLFSFLSHAHEFFQSVSSFFPCGPSRGEFGLLFQVTQASRSGQLCQACIGFLAAGQNAQ